MLLPCIATRALVSKISSQALMSSNFVRHQPQKPLKPFRLPDLPDKLDHPNVSNLLDVQKSDNLQYNMLGCWLNVSSPKYLLVNVLF